jgi:hypothetical protein
MIKCPDQSYMQVCLCFNYEKSIYTIDHYAILNNPSYFHLPLVLVGMTFAELGPFLVRRPKQHEDRLNTRVHRRNHSESDQRIIRCTLCPCLCTGPEV